jgi:hypothetical protein
LSWCESNQRSLSHIPHIPHLPHIPNLPRRPSQTIIDYHGLIILIQLKNHWIAWYNFCSMKHLPDGMHTVHACCIFKNIKYEICNTEILKYWHMIGSTKKDKNKKITKRKSTVELSWCESNLRPLLHIPYISHISHTDHQRPSKTITDYHSLTTLIQLKNHWLAWYNFCSMKHLPDGIYTVHEYCIFWKHGIWNMTYDTWYMIYEIWNMKDERWHMIGWTKKRRK